MVDAVSSSSSVNAINGTEFKGMSIQMMAAMVMLEVGATKKKEAEMKIGEMKAQNDRAKQINDIVDRMTCALGTVSTDDDDSYKSRTEILSSYSREWYNLGLSIPLPTGKVTADAARGVTSQLQHMAENCNSDNQTQMVKLQDFMGQYNSFVSGASDQIKTANQILQGLAKS